MRKPRTPDQFVKDIAAGVDHGATPFVLVWISKAKRFAIFKKAGCKYWSGIGNRGYAPTAHLLMDLAADPERGHTLYVNARIKEVEGRISRAALDALKALGEAGERVEKREEWTPAFAVAGMNPKDWRKKK